MDEANLRFCLEKNVLGMWAAAVLCDDEKVNRGLEGCAGGMECESKEKEGICEDEDDSCDTERAWGLFVSPVG